MDVRPDAGLGVTTFAALARPVRGLWWWLTGVLGEHDYAHYREHVAATHPGQEPMSEREYWRRRWAAQDANPGARCC